MRQRILPLLLGALSLFFTQSHAFAQAAAQEEPETTVLSDTLTHDDAKKLSIFKGNVILTRGLLRLTADELHLNEDANGFQHGKAIMKSKKKVIIIEERPETINNRSEFGHWEIDIVLGQKTKGEAVIMTLVERQTRLALVCKLPNK